MVLALLPRAAIPLKPQSFYLRLGEFSETKFHADIRLRLLSVIADARREAAQVLIAERCA